MQRSLSKELFDDSSTLYSNISRFVIFRPTICTKCDNLNKHEHFCKNYILDVPGPKVTGSTLISKK